MAKTDIRTHDLTAAPVPAWFAAAPARGAADDEWDWLSTPPQAMEVTEFAVTDAFIASLFGGAA